MAGDIKVTITDNTDEFMAAVVEKVPLMLHAIGTTAEGYAKDDCPVDTGLLRNSIVYALSGEAPVRSAYVADKPDQSGVTKSGTYDGATEADVEPDQYSLVVGSNVAYAPINELGDSISHTVGKAHFIRDALQDHKDEYRDIILAIMKTIDGVK